MFYTRLSHSSAAATHLLPCPWGWQPGFPLGWKLSSPELLLPAQWNLAHFYTLQNHWLGEAGRGLCSSFTPNWNKLPQRSQTTALCHGRPQNPTFLNQADRGEDGKYKIPHLVAHNIPDLRWVYLILPVSYCLKACAKQLERSHPNHWIFFTLCNIIYEYNGQMVTQLGSNAAALQRIPCYLLWM